MSDFFESPLLSVAHVTSSGSPTRHTLANHVSVKRALLTIGDRCFGDADLKEVCYLGASLLCDVVAF